MKNVSYIVSDWEKVKGALNKLMGSGWTDGMIGALKQMSNNLEGVDADIQRYDSDGFVTFGHISQADRYHEIFEDFEILKMYSESVGDIVDRTIDQPFYEDIDAFVESMRDINILDYTTENRIGATEESTIYAGHGVRESIEIPKGEVSLDDLLSGDNFYAEQMNIEYEAWKRENPDQDFTKEEYSQAVVNSGAFEYTSIKNEQQNTEFWGNIVALVVIVGVAIVSPPVGLTLGIAYGGLELGSSATGKDWMSGRELDSQERTTRGLLAPLDIIPGVAGVNRFSKTVRTANLTNAGRLGTTTGLGPTIQHELRHVGDMAIAAGQQSKARIRNAGAAAADMTRVAKAKLSGTPVISKADRAKLDNWGRPPSDKLYLDNKKVYDNKMYFDQQTGAPIYPGTKNPQTKIKDPNTDGFINGKYNEQVLTKATIIDRYGDNGTGQYFSPDGSTYESRALPPFMQDKPYERYEVIKEFEVKSGKVAPWFGEKGKGIQHYTDLYIKDEFGNQYKATIANLEKYGYLRKVD